MSWVGGEGRCDGKGSREAVGTDHEESRSEVGRKLERVRKIVGIDLEGSSEWEGSEGGTVRTYWAEQGGEEVRKRLGREGRN